MSNLTTKTNQRARNIYNIATPEQEHINNLIDMCLVRKNDTETISTITRILKNCKNEYEMSRKLHDVWTGNKTIDTFIQQYGGGLLC